MNTVSHYLKVKIPRQPTFILVLAIAVGAWLRFANLGADEMSSDEGASWAAAAAPTIREVVRRQASLNAGKLAVHELAMRSWIGIFGDGLVAMRALSAVLGTIAILFVYWIARELFRPDPRAQPQPGDQIGAISALLVAVNLAMIKYSREARMYPVLLVATLGQVIFFVRSSRRGGLWNCAGLSLFTALAVASNFTGALVPVAEGLWLVCLLVVSRREKSSLWTTAIALGAGFVLLLPLILPALMVGVSLVNRGVIGWIAPPSLRDPIAIFKNATGKRTFFWPMVAIAGWGVWKAWRWAPAALSFALLWMWAPMLILLAVSYAYTPMLIERYVLTCIVPFLILVSVGISQLGSMPVRFAAVVVLVAASLGYVHHYDRKPRDVEWREGVSIAVKNLGAGQGIAVAPPYSVFVARYYAPPAQRADVVPAATSSPWPDFLVTADTQLDTAGAYLVAYPRVIARLRGVEVRAR